jgi:hypothetical protein
VAAGAEVDDQDEKAIRIITRGGVQS